MRGEMVQIVQNVRSAHPELELAERLHGRSTALYSALEELVECPEAQADELSKTEIALMPEVRDIMCAPQGAEVNQDTFIALREHMGAMVEGRRSRVCDDLRALLTRARGANEASTESDSGTGADPLDLATTMFRSPNAGSSERERFLFYPEILRYRHRYKAGSDAYCDFIAQAMWLFSDSLFFRVDLCLVHKPSEEALRLIQLCGKDPKTATVKEMDSLDVRFVVDDKTIMTWRAAMSHQDAKWWRGEKWQWRLASPEEVSQAKECEREIRRSSLWKCIRCPPRTSNPTSFDAALSHLDAVHSVKDPTSQYEYLTLAPGSPAANGVYEVELQRRGE